MDGKQIWRDISKKWKRHLKDGKRARKERLGSVLDLVECVWNAWRQFIQGKIHVEGRGGRGVGAVRLKSLWGQDREKRRENL